MLLGEAWRHFNAREFEGAAKAFDAAYRLVLEAQPQGRRYHKGEALHNKGLALLWVGRHDAALDETLAAFVEDAASLAEENPKLEELDRPAAHNLVYVFGRPGPPLADFAHQVRGLIRSGALLPDPHPLLRTPVGEYAARVPSAARASRIIGAFTQPPERRVFIGGWYRRLEATLCPLRDHLYGLGYDGVIAADFGIPAGWGEDEIALSLLTDCHYAIFEVSESAGQVEEVSDVPETMRTPTRVLAVFDRTHAPTPGISKGMTLTKLARWNVEPASYSDIEELKACAEEWLKEGSTPDVS